MKRYILSFFPLFILSFLFSSCLFDDKELFEESAAERIEHAVEADRALLEGATEGWQLQLYTGTNYSGGGYTMFLTFRDGKVRVSGDIAPDSMVCQSSYDIARDQGPVLTFNTYNPILHLLAEPSASALSGMQGDYEFVIQRATQDSIYLKGKKFGNKHVMTRLAPGTSVQKTIQQMQYIVQHVGGYFASDNDYLVVDPSTRRIYFGNQDINGTPYCPTATGLTLQQAKHFGKQTVSQLTWDDARQTLMAEGSTTQYVAVQPIGYNRIQDWVGNWKLRYLDLDASTYGYFPLRFEAEEEYISQPALASLRGFFEVSGYTFELIVYYSPITGTISIPAQYIDDPTGTYDLFLLLGTDAYQDELSWYAVSWDVTYDSETNQFMLVGNDAEANGLDMNTLQMLAVNSQGQLIGTSEGLPIALVSLPFVDYLVKSE